MKHNLWRFLLLLCVPARIVAGPYDGWSHTGSVYLLTGPDGADLPASASVEGFPALIRLHQDFFNFTEARPSGDDLRISTANGEPLAYQIEEWAPDKGTAAIWVRVPRIRGNERQELKLHWGKSDAVSESNGGAVFSPSNGYLSVWHMNGPVKDEVGSLESTDVGTTATTGVIGEARHLAGEQGIFGGEKINNYPVGSDPHTTEMWFRAERSNGRPIAWGNEQAQGKIVMNFQSPPHVSMDCYFSGANVSSHGPLPLHEWLHVVHTYQKGRSCLYVNGALSGISTNEGAPLALQSPERLFIGGWYHQYDFIGDIDEVRVSKVPRSADWVKLEYENQRLQPTLTGPIVRPGNVFSVSETQATVLEGQSATFAAQAAGAMKLYWTLVRDGLESTVAVDRLRFTFDAGRVTSNQIVKLRLKAIYPEGPRTQNISIQIKEAIDEPVFSLVAPATWDGRSHLEIAPQVENLRAMQAQGAGELHTDWTVGPFAVIREVAPGKLILKRAQKSGKLTVTASIHNGGKPVTQSAIIEVTEPATDPWIVRAPSADEKPENGQFYARDDRDEATLYYNGRLAEAADSAFLRLFADETLIQTVTAQLQSDRSYALSVPLKPGLIQYKVEFGARSEGREVVLDTVTNLVCGDAYLIDGQSNGLATDTGEKSPPETHPWIRSYGRPPDDSSGATGNLWCLPVWKAEAGETAELGWWGMELAKRLVASQKIPIFMINAAVGGTRIDQHQRQPDHPTNLNTIYGRMLWRVQHARLTHGIRAILWHQGENDQGADGPTGGYGWETYHPLFIEMSSAWKQDFPNVRHYYVFQIWPDSCSMGGPNGSGDMLRERQRTLADLFSNLDVMSTLGVRPAGPCHFPLAGWGEFARLIQPLIERDFYGKTPTTSITPPNLRQAYYATGARDALVLEFDQPVVWREALVSQFYLDGKENQVASGSASGNLLTLQLKSPSSAGKVTYLKERSWSQDRLLTGANGIAALTFCQTPITGAPGGR